MSPAIRIIPCLDVDKGRVVKGVRFKRIRDAGDPVEIAMRYNEEGADEIAFLDITASIEGRRTMIDVVEKVSRRVFIPLSVGGGVGGVDDVRNLLNAGADKVAINTAALGNIGLVGEIADRVGSQCLIVAIDAKRKEDSGWEVYTHGGRRPTGVDAIEWARRVVETGAGEILLTSMDRDGTRNGFDIALTRTVSEAVSVPVIASGGVGTMEHLAQGILDGLADAVLAASIFHFREHTVREVKRYLQSRGIEVRL